MPKQNKSCWQPLVANDCPEKMRNWLSDAGSFMQRLEQHGVSSASINVLSQEWRLPESWEAESVGIEQGEAALIREVTIASGHCQWLYARAVLSKGFVSHRTAFESLGDRPLGSMLFTDVEITRSPLEFIFITPELLWQTFSPLAQSEASWIRRSTFYLKDEALLLTEIVMPDVVTL